MSTVALSIIEDNNNYDESNDKATPTVAISANLSKPIGSTVRLGLIHRSNHTSR